MRRVLQQFEQFTQQLREGLEESDNYLNKYSQENNVYAEIEEEEKQLQELMQNLKVEAALTEIVEAQRREPIADHHLLPCLQMRELAIPLQSDMDLWIPILQPHHELTFTVKIVRVLPFSRYHEHPQPLPNLKFHLHLFDAHSQTPYLICHPQLSRKEDFYQGRSMRSDNSVTLKIVLKLRQGNCALYSELVKRGESAVLVAQSLKGEVIGKAVIDLGNIFSKKRQEFRCLTLELDNLEDGQPDGTVGNNTLLMETYCKVGYEIIAPPLEDLQRNLNEQVKTRKNSKSPSPNRLVSLTPPRNGSPKKKKQLISATELANKPISITIFEQWQYKHSLGTTAPVSKQLTYKQLTNLIERKVQLVRIGQEYFLKCWAHREGEGEGKLLFQFGNKDYSLTVIPNHLFEILQYNHYAQLQRDKRLFSPNKMVRLPGGVLIYPSSRLRIIKNHAKQTITEGLLGSLFLKTLFEDCEIYVLSPFELAGIVNKQQEYLIHIYCDSPQTTTILLFIHSKGELQEIHMFDCLVERRFGNRQTLFRRASVPQGETICDLDLGNIVNESYEYWMRSSDPKVHLINAQQYRTTYGPLRLQLSAPLTGPLMTELLFYDSKYRSFSLQILLTPTLISNEQ